MTAAAEPMHWLVPGSIDQRTGGYRYDARIVQGLRGRGCEVRVHELPGRFPRLDATSTEAMATALAGLDAGAVVVIDGLAGGLAGELLAPAAGRLRPIALVHHPLGDEAGLDADEAKSRLRAESRTLGAVCGAIVTSDFTAARLAELGVDPERIRVVPPGTAPAPRADGPGPTEAPVLLCVGTLIPRKAQLDLVAALARLRPLRWRCALVGSAERDPGYAERVRAAVDAAGLDDRIEIAGEVDDDELDRRWAGASVAVLPSRYEGYGMVLTEALARGLPVVATTGGAIPATVPQGAGLLVPPGDVEALAEALRRVLTDDRTREELRSGARRAAAALRDWPERAQQFETAVGELIR